MKWLLGPLPDGRYELKAFAHDAERNGVAAFATFHGTHTAEGGPVRPTGKKVAAADVDVVAFGDGDEIRQMTRILDAGWPMRELAWG